ncbi:O-antigen ligase family protein [Paenibacillus sp. Sa2BVA9]|uniref:O-antigen ligase family protein n=1 Tax=Paenibacillus gallinarum TaxID=2762232 RepID=A0ABR8T4V9_9BACL|nr:O-antigen ligase family protein [Paenibacillus gallinarum]
MSLSIGTLFCFFMSYYKKKKLYYVYALFLLILSSFTGSRKSLVAVMLGIFLLIFLKNRSKKILKTVSIIISFGMILYFILNLPMFDAVLGRMESFYNLLIGNGTVDNSSLTRSNMISFGWELFLDKPAIGYGYDSFRFYWGGIDRATYSHNNYIEMLVNGGLIAFISYYLMYAYSLYKLGKLSYRFNEIAILFFVIIIISLILDVAAITYYSKVTFIHFAIFFSYIRVANPVSTRI